MWRDKRSGDLARWLAASALIVGLSLATDQAAASPISGPSAAATCRVRHVVDDAVAFGAVVSAQRRQHLDQSFRPDSIYRQLATAEFVVPDDHRVFWSQPIPLGPIAPPAEWGYRRHPIYGTIRFHNGLDAPAAAGTPVAALASGRVVIAGHRGGYGQVVVVDHGDGFSTVYAHLSARSVTEGATVGAGEMIGRVGATGAATGPHLHVETRIGGVPVDPRWFVPLLASPTGSTGSSRVPVTEVVPGGEGARYQIERLYLAAFGRRPTESEASYWMARCETGTPLEQIAAAALANDSVVDRVGVLAATQLVELSGAPEIHQQLADALLDPGVRRLYLAILGREPDVSGSYYWSSRAAGGESLISLAADMADTMEFRQRFGQLDDRAFLDRLYRLLFGRAPDEPGLDYWSDRIAAAGRWVVLVGFTESPEGRAALG